MTQILSFQIHDAIFGIPMEYVEWIFDIDSYEKVAFLPPYVYGKVRYHDQHYFLISINAKLNLPLYPDPIGKLGIAVNIHDKKFIIVADEILHIQEQHYESNTAQPTSMFIEQGKVGELLLKNFFEDIVDLTLSAPSLPNKSSPKSHKKSLSFVLCTLGERGIAFPNDYVKHAQIVENNINFTNTDTMLSGILHYNSYLVNVIDTKHYLRVSNTKSSYENVLVIANSKGVVGVGLDTIINIVEVPEDTIKKEINTQKLFSGHFLYKDKIFHIINSATLDDMIQNYGFCENTATHSQSSSLNTQRFLLIDSNYALPIETVRCIKEYEDIEVLRTLTTTVGIESFITLMQTNYYLFAMHHLHNEKKEIQYIIALENQEDNFSIAIGVHDNIDLVEIPKERIFTLQNLGEQFCQGTFDYAQSSKKIIDVAWLRNYIKSGIAA